MNALDRAAITRAIATLRDGRPSEVSAATKRQLEIFFDNAVLNRGRRHEPQFVSRYEASYVAVNPRRGRVRPAELRQFLHLDLADGGPFINTNDGLLDALRTVNRPLLSQIDENVMFDSARTSQATNASIRVSMGTLLGRNRAARFKQRFPQAMFVAGVHIKDKRPLESRARELSKVGAGIAITGVRHGNQLLEALTPLKAVQVLPSTVDIDIHLCDHLGEPTFRGVSVRKDVVDILKAAKLHSRDLTVTADGLYSPEAREVLLGAAEEARFQPERLLVRPPVMLSLLQLRSFGAGL